MAVRKEELYGAEVAAVYRLPTAGRADLRRRYLARRVVAVAILAVVLSAPFFLLAALGGAPSTPAPVSQAAAPARVRVGPGQTLWDVTRLYARPGADPRAYVGRVVGLNHLEGRPLQAGMQLRLPR